MNKIYTLLFITVFSFYFSSAQTSQLWGVTSGGGPESGGTMFYLTLGDSGLNVAYVFDGVTGYMPNGSLTQANNGLFYGMTEEDDSLGNGVIFDYDPVNKIYDAVHYFDGTNGAYPYGNLIMVGDSLLYGMTQEGGANNDGVIFSFDPRSNTFNHLYDLIDSGGRFPYGSLIHASDGKLYGLTSSGGTDIDSAGTLFSFDITNNTFTNLHNFVHATGDIPNGSLLIGNNGLLYGMTSQGGANTSGVIFSYNITDSVYMDFYDFYDSAGANPFGSLIQASDSDLYGMTSGGGSHELGVIFNFNLSTHIYADLLDFNGANGSSPNADLIQSSSNDKLYGMTTTGGANNAGVLFSFDPSNSNFFDLVDFSDSIGEYPMGNLIELFTTGIPVLTDNVNIQLYPNPAGSELDIKGEHVRIEGINIYSVLGEKVYTSQSGIENADAETIINVSALSEGVYFVHVLFAAANSQTQDVWVGRFVKE